MRRTIIILSFLLFIASAGAAQNLPFTIMCLADSDKPLEVTFCKYLFAAAQAQPGMRPSTADDTSAVIVMVIPKEEGDIAAVAVHVAFNSRSMRSLSFSIATGCDVITGDNAEEKAIYTIEWVFTRGAQWLVDAPERMEPTLDTGAVEASDD